MWICCLQVMLLKTPNRELMKFGCGFRGLSDRDWDSGSKGQGFKSRIWANFQRLDRIFEIGIHMSYFRASFNGELRGAVPGHCVAVRSMLQGLARKQMK